MASAIILRNSLFNDAICPEIVFFYYIGQFCQSQIFPTNQLLNIADLKWGKFFKFGVINVISCS